jgi:PKD repeat protein
MTLVSPSGRRIGRDSTDWDVSHTVSGTHETYVVKVPEPGEWRVELYGADVPSSGEPVVFGASQVPFENALPSVTGTASAASGRAPHTVTFTANATDPDGSVADILWRFGDGTTARGATVRNTYRNPGSYTPTVTAIDEAGEPATANLAAVTVTGRRPVARFRVKVRGRRVKVNASPSSDPDGKIVRYGWDFNGDGKIDRQTRRPRARFKYRKRGRYTVTLGVQAKSGEQDAVRRKVSIRRRG